MEDNEIMTIQEVSQYLKMNERTVYKLIQAGQIPAAKLGKQYRLNKDKINEWLGFKVAELELDELECLEKDHKEAVVAITPLLKKESIVFNFYAVSKSQAIQKLSSVLAKAHDLSSEEEQKLISAVIERERLCSTAIGEGVAIPHPRDVVLPDIKKPLLAVGVVKNGMDFESIDGKPTHLVFLLVAPKSDIHLRIMARLSRLLRDKAFRYKLSQATNYEEFMKIIKDKKDALAKEAKK